MKKSRLLLSSIIAFTLFAAGCATPSKDHYYWGSYQTLILKMYVEPGSAAPLTQIEKLTADLQQADSDGKPPPPGLYAHLGMMYAMNGDIAEAEAAFLEEKNLFPEAEVFINGMMERVLLNSGVEDAAKP